MKFTFTTLILLCFFNIQGQEIITSKSPYYQYDTIFNEANSPIFAITKNAYGKLVDSTLFDQKGNKIEVIYYNQSRKKSSSESFAYNVKGNMIEWSFYNSKGKLDSKRKYQYDENGNVIKSENYNSEGIVDSKNFYSYDRLGNQIKVEKYFSEGKSIIKYDSYGNEIEYTIYNSEDESTYKTTKKYNDKGKLIQSIIFSPNRTHITNDKYDDNGNIILRTSFIDSVLFSKKTYRYYEEYKEEEEVGYNSKGEVIEKKYSKFDGKGREVERNKSYYDDAELYEKISVKTNHEKYLTEEIYYENIYRNSQKMITKYKTITKYDNEWNKVIETETVKLD
ncbi:MAG: hypothetical protein N4A35_11190 [Flavobacteriales bacterium]|jgi:hypothetical protein|nr:hypothetical protein [Flavobacteriales bacterium]